MKKRWFSGLLIAALSVFGEPQDLSSRLEKACSLANQPAKGELGRLRIPGDVFDQATRFPADVRILDEAGTQWPYFIVTPTDRTVSKKHTPQILNKSFVSGAEPHWELDLIMPGSGEPTVHNQLEISTTGRDFIRRVEIFHGASAHLASGYLIDLSGHPDARNSTVAYPDSDAKRVHLKIYTSAKTTDDSFEVHQVSAYYLDRIPAERESVPAVNGPVPETEQSERNQTFILDTGFRNRPVEWITFDIADSSFVRAVSIYGRNAETDSWSSAGGGEIHRLGTDTSTTVSVRAPYRWIKIVTRQDDNLPIDVKDIRLEAIPRYFVFEAASDLPARLCFRGSEIRSPVYDLNRRLSESEALALPVYTLNPSTDNAVCSPCIFKKYAKVFSGIAVGAVSLLTIWVILRMMRHPPAAEK